MCLHFTDFFVSFAGDTTLDISRQSMTMRRHRSRRERRRRLNVIGFSQSLQDSQDSSEDESDAEDVDVGLQPPEPSFGLAAASSSSLEEGYIDRLDKMSSELDGLVRFIRRGVESFAGGTGEAAPAFGVLAFALEDWDI
jgi:gamma-tubulin complex component 5